MHISYISEIFQKSLQLITKKKKNGLDGCVYNFSLDYDTIDISNTTSIHKYLIQ